MPGSITDADLEAILALCPRLYGAVGWNAGKAPDWDTFRACCHPDATLAALSSGAASPIAVEAFVAAMNAQRAAGALTDFSEIEIARHVEAFGNVAGVRSSFIAEMNGEKRRGVTFAHIVRHEGRWVILSAIWDNESDEKSMPASLV
ncbi:nuclear transport factor 2 family protein [Sphingosinicella microcystinivorans]|uniref:nuclear transport factor 2 family protein n=1 Tax=Sphingosinicella microcystinivorans TaxID=335406 RepID=UPI0022F3D3BE|nr:nuclear transport factor 2 family protein [Sphingosinicella microcystinivorans]WBX84564.1 nuclear transport factor 2 family protein [Sphingosinicella microcystinivorans]